MIDLGAWFWPVLLAPFIGSFLGVLVTRAEAPGGIVFGRSACDRCGVRLRPRDLIPLLSWLLLRGCCRACGQPIGLFHPIVELAAVAVALWSAALFSGPLLWIGCCFGWALLALAATDLKFFLLPDFLTLPLIPAGLIVIWAFDPPGLLDHAIGAIVGYVFVIALRQFYWRLRRLEGMGLGDAKLLAASGAWVSWTGLPTVVLLAAITGLGFALLGGLRGGALSLTSRVPFGTFLSFATWIVWLYGPLTAG